MTIKLLTQEEYDKLLDIQQKCPKLTFENKGYEYIDRRLFSEEEVEYYRQVSVILREHIKDFVRFDNFRMTTGELVIRFQYHYDISFTGVGYIKAIELLNGF